MGLICCNNVNRNTTTNNVYPKCPSRPFESIAIDILQIGQGTEAVYILGMVDHLTHYLKLARVPSLKLEDSMNQLMCWILEFNITESSNDLTKYHTVFPHYKICTIELTISEK